MPLSRIGDSVLYFVHIPKTGGSSVEAYLAAKGPLALRHNRRADWSKTTPQHMPAHVFSTYVPDVFYDHSFVILRDPVARLLSTFRMRADHDHVWKNPVNWLFWVWGRVRGRTVYSIGLWKFKLSVDVDTWVALVLRLRRRWPYLYDGHLLAQTDYLLPGQTVFLFEEGLQPVFRWIDQVTNTRAVPGEFHEKKAPAVTVELSPETDLLVRTVYSSDLAEIESRRKAPVGGKV